MKDEFLPFIPEPTFVPIGSVIPHVLSEHNLRGPHFEPPYDSPIEEMFAWEIVKHLSMDISFRRQVSVNTLAGRFRMDFVLSSDSRRIGIECDGKAYHDSSRDEWRDAMILGSEAVDVIYRFNGGNIVNCLHDCLFILSVLERSAFSKRGLQGLRILASRTLHKEHFYCLGYEFLTHGVFDEIDGYDYVLRIWRRSRHHALNLDTPSWVRYFNFANRNRGLGLDDLIQLYRETYMGKRA